MNLDRIVGCAITPHALSELGRRGITEEEIRRVLEHPEQSELAGPGRIVVQSRLWRGAPPKEYLLRVFVMWIDNHLKS